MYTQTQATDNLRSNSKRRKTKYTSANGATRGAADGSTNKILLFRPHDTEVENGSLNPPAGGRCGASRCQVGPTRRAGA